MACLPLSEFPVLETQRLLLTEMTEAEIDINGQLRNDWDAMRYLDRPRAQTQEQRRIHFEQVKEMETRGEGLLWCIYLKENQQFIGTIGFFRTNHESNYSEIGYMLFPAFWKMGIMTEAATCVLQFAFEKLMFHRIEANINPGNEASRALLMKLGFRKEAYFVENFFFNNQYLDSEMYGILGREWKSRHNPLVINN